MRVELADRLRIVDLGEKPLACGGEAGLYLVPGEPNLLAKVYTDGRAAARRDKLAWMVAHPPWDPPSPTGYRKFAWPVEALRDPVSKEFVGFLMPRVPDARLLAEVVNPAA